MRDGSESHPPGTASSVSWRGVEASNTLASGVFHAIQQPWLKSPSCAGHWAYARISHAWDRTGGPRAAPAPDGQKALLSCKVGSNWCEGVCRGPWGLCRPPPRVGGRPCTESRARPAGKPMWERSLTEIHLPLGRASPKPSPLPPVWAWHGADQGSNPTSARASISMCLSLSFPVSRMEVKLMPLAQSCCGD